MDLIPKGATKELANYNDDTKVVFVSQISRRGPDKRQECINTWNFNRHLRVRGPFVESILDFRASPPDSRLGKMIRFNDIQTISQEIDAIGKTLVDVSFSFSVFSASEGAQKRLRVNSYHLAILCGRPDVLELLLEACESIEGALDGKTFFELSLKDDLLYPDDQELDELNAVHLAARYDIDCLEVILSKLGSIGASKWREVLNCASGSHKLTPLHLAVKNDDVRAVSLLLNADASVNAAAIHGLTPLHVASMIGNEKNVRLLLDYGGDATFTDSNGRSPLDYALTANTVAMMIHFASMGEDELKMESNVRSDIFANLLSRNIDAANEVLNASISTNGKPLFSDELCLVFDLSIFKGVTKNGGQFETELNIFDEIKSHRASRLLRNPLLAVFQHMKRDCLISYYTFIIIMYAMFAIFTTVNVTIIRLATFEYKLLYQNLTYENYTQTDQVDTLSHIGIHLDEVFGHEDISESYKWVFYVWSGLTSAATLIILFTIMWKIAVAKRWPKWKNTHYIDIGLDIFMVAMVVLGALIIFEDIDLSLDLGAIAIFIVWMRFILLEGEWPFFGITLYSAVQVAGPILTILFLYAQILFAFALVFFILLPFDKIYDNYGEAFMKTVTMMVGEFEYEDHFVANDAWFDPYYILPNMVFITFLVTVAIVLQNLMIAMTITEMQEIYYKADIVTAERQIYPLLMAEQILNWLSEVCCCVGGQRLIEMVKCRSLVSSYMEKYGGEDSENGVTHRMVCVKPHSRKKGVLLPTDDETVIASLVSYISKERFKIYFYNESTRTAGKKTKFTLPKNIVKSALKLILDGRYSKILGPSTISGPVMTSMRPLDDTSSESSDGSRKTRARKMFHRMKKPSNASSMGSQQGVDNPAFTKD